MVEHTIHTLQIEKLLKQYRKQMLKHEYQDALSTAEFLIAETKLLWNATSHEISDLKT